MLDEQIARLEGAIEAIADLDLDALTDDELDELVIGLFLATRRLDSAVEHLRSLREHDDDPDETAA